MLQQLDLFGDAPTNRPEANLAKQKGKYKITPPKIIVSDEHKKIQDAPEENTNIHAVETKSKTQVKQKKVELLTLTVIELRSLTINKIIIGVPALTLGRLWYIMNVC